VIGVDGGASSTRAALLDENLGIIAQGLGGPADHFSEQSGRERLTQSLQDALSPILALLSRDPGFELKAVCLGLTGVFIPGKRDAAVHALHEVFSGIPVLVVSDTVTAWAGAHEGKDGVVVIGGTGSVAYGRSGDREVRKGGFGYLLGDEGSGFKTAAAAVSAALHDADGTGPSTSLTAVVARYFNVDDVRKAPGKVYSENIPVDRIAALCPMISEEADKGDEEAKRLLTKSGRDLGLLAAAALRDLGPKGKRVSYVGGVFKAGEPLLRPFRERILAEIPDAVIVPPVHNPSIGAGILAWARVRKTG